MSQSPTPNEDNPNNDTKPEWENFQADGGRNIHIDDGNYNEGIKRDYIQADQVNVNSYYIQTFNFPTSTDFLKNSLSDQQCQQCQQDQEALMDASPDKISGKTSQVQNQEKRASWLVKLECHTYEGRLVSIKKPEFSNNSQQNRKLTTLMLLDIAFGEAKEDYIEPKKLCLDRQTRHREIRFGIKFGELCLKFSNKDMLFEHNRSPEAEKICGEVTSVGTTKIPKWQFRAKDKVVLFGNLIKQELGTIIFSDSLCEVEVTFQVSGVNSNNLEITAQDGLWNENTSKKVKETKIRAFFKKVVEPKLKDYVYKGIWKYDSAVVS